MSSYGRRYCIALEDWVLILTLYKAQMMVDGPNMGCKNKVHVRDDHSYFCAPECPKGYYDAQTDALLAPNFGGGAILVDSCSACHNSCQARIETLKLNLF